MTDSSLTILKSGNLIISDTGRDGIQGIQGPQGEQGIPGPPTSVMTVTAYGAVGNGIVDDTTALQAAINAAYAARTTLLWPSGNYKTSSSLVIPADIHIIGEHVDFKSAAHYGNAAYSDASLGKGTWIVPTHTSGAVLEFNAGGTLYMSADVSNIGIRGPGTGTLTGLLLSAKTTRSRFSNIRVLNCSVGINVTTSYDNSFYDVGAWGCKTGIYLNGANRSNFANTNLAANELYGLRINNTQVASFKTGSTESNNGVPIYLEGASSQCAFDNWYLNDIQGTWGSPITYNVDILTGCNFNSFRNCALTGAFPIHVVGVDNQFINVTGSSIVEAVAGTNLKLDDFVAGVNAVLTANVKTYGAIGDGSANDTAAINLAIATVPVGSKVFFPAGTYKVSPTSLHMIIVAKQKITLEGENRDGTIIKVANSVGDYNSIISDGTVSGTNSMSGLTIKNITIDQNSANNTMSDVVGAPLFTTSPRYCVRVFNGNDGRIENVRFTNTDNVNTITMNGGTVINRWTINDCVFDNVGNGLTHDHSSIYFHGEDITIKGCSFQGGGPAAVSAIETHGGGQLVHNNRVTGYITGGNITGISGITSKGIIWADNVIKGAGSGLHLWAYDYGGLSGYALDNVIIRNNQIEIDYDAWSSVVMYRSGILLNILSTAVARNVKIVGNQITYLSYAATPTSTDNQSAGILWYRGVAVTEGTEEVDIEISDNLIKGALSSGVYYQPGVLTKRLTMRNNTIVDAGNGAPNAAYRVGILISASTTGVHDCTISDNVFVDTYGTHKLVYAIDTNFTTSGVVNGRILDNVVRAVDAAVIPIHNGTATSPWRIRTAGTGTPEAVVAAPIGSLFTRTDGSTSTTLYVKETGTGAAGWVGIGASNVAAWTTYVPTWTASAGTPVKNNGTLTGRYRQIGKTVDFVVYLLAGSTTTYGTSGAYWIFTLPPVGNTTQAFAFPLRVLDAAVIEYGGIASVAAGASSVEFFKPVSGRMYNNDPFTFGNTDSLWFNGTYEVV